MEEKLMRTNGSENLFVSGQYNVQSRSYCGEEKKIIVNEYFGLELSPDEFSKRKQDFEREAMPHIGLLFNYALKISGNHDDADALLQDTYTRAFRFFHKYEEKTSCKVWLGRIMRNCFIDKYREDKAKKNSESNVKPKQ